MSVIEDVGMFIDALNKLGDVDKEEEYTSDSLKFIKTNRTNFEPILTNIVVDLNTKPDKEWIELMNIMKEDKSVEKDNYNRWLKELIVKLLIKKKTKDGSTAIDFKTKYTDEKDKNKYHADYLNQSLDVILRPGKDNMKYMTSLLIVVMRAMQNNQKMINFVEKFKKDNKDWKTMVGMLIPVNAHVKLNTENTENTEIVTSQEVNGVILNRGQIIKGVNKLAKGVFKKRMSIPTGTLRDLKRTYIDVNPIEVQLVIPQPYPGKSAKKGGEQRVSKKQKKSIETTKKTRRKDRNIAQI
jgi:predicted RNA-binding protein Jag